MTNIVLLAAIGGVCSTKYSLKTAGLCCGLYLTLLGGYKKAVAKKDEPLKIDSMLEDISTLQFEYVRVDKDSLVIAFKDSNTTRMVGACYKDNNWKVVSGENLLKIEKSSDNVFIIKSRNIGCWATLTRGDFGKWNIARK